MAKGKTTDRSNLIALRREIVADLDIKGNSIRRIVSILEEKHPELAAKKSTVQNDLAFLEAESVKRAGEAIDKHVARSLNTIDRVLKEAWKRGDLGMVLKCEERRAKLLGLDKPNRVELAGKDGGAIEVADARESIQRKLARIAAEQDEE